MSVKKISEENKQDVKNKGKQKKYYEVWGDSLNMLFFLRTICLLLMFAVIGLILLLRQNSDKLPLVVKVDSLGKSEVIKNWQSEVYVTPPEISNFTQTFIELFTAQDFYTYDENFRKAFKMMTPECQKKIDEQLQANNVVEQIKQAQYKTKVNISKIDITKDSKEAVFVKVKGYREILSYQNTDFRKEIVFETDLILKKEPRDFRTPWGVLVDYYNETIFKEK